MAVNQTTRERIEMVKDEIRTGIPRHQIVENLAPVFHMARRSVDRIITKAKLELAEEDKARKELSDEIRREEIEIARQRLITEVEVQARLAQIIMGERIQDKIVYTDKGAELMRTAPSAREMLKAIGIFYEQQAPKGYQKDTDGVYRLESEIIARERAEKEAKEKAKEKGEARVQEKTKTEAAVEEKKTWQEEMNDFMKENSEELPPPYKKP